MPISISLYRAFVLLVSIGQLFAANNIIPLSLSPRSASSSAAVVLSLTVSLTTSSLTLVSADEANNAPPDAATSEAAAQECKEDDNTCTNSEGGEEDAGSSSTDEAATSASDDNQTTNNNFEIKHGPNGDRLITHEELALHIGAGGASPTNPIWLSILGKVYDVTTGEDFYGESKGSYKFYSGRDASPCFSSGNNTPEGASEKLEEWEDKKLMSVWEWSDFYANHETYKYLGILVGSRYYDDEGKELPLREEIVSRAQEAKREFDVEKERKRRERMAAREARKKANDQKK